MGPTEVPHNVVQHGSGKDCFHYRVCRKFENPWQLRDPPDLSDMPFLEQRAIVLSAISQGNLPRFPSPFLHATRSLRRCWFIFCERRSLYSHWIVRWPKSKDCLDFEAPGIKNKYFAERDGDTSLIAALATKCLSYTAKDSEVVYMHRPDMSEVDWWDETTMSWHNCLDSAKSQQWMGMLASKKATCSGALAEDSKLTQVG